MPLKIPEGSLLPDESSVKSRSVNKMIVIHQDIYNDISSAPSSQQNTTHRRSLCENTIRWWVCFGACTYWWHRGTGIHSMTIHALRNYRSPTAMIAENVSIEDVYSPCILHAFLNKKKVQLEPAPRGRGF